MDAEPGRDEELREEEMAPSVRRIRALRRYLEQRWRVLAAILAIVLGLFVLGRSLSTVAPGESAALVRWGKLVDDRVGPGLHLRLPLGVDRLEKWPTGEVVRMVLEGRMGRGLELLTADMNLIEVSAVVQYRIHELGAYLFASEYPDALVQGAVRGALVRAVGSQAVDEVLTSGRAAIQLRVRQEAQERLDSYGAGIAVVGVNLQSVDPPQEAAEAFRQVQDARAQAARAVSRAEGERVRGLSLARGRAQRMLSEANTAADNRLQAARGAADRFLSLRAQALRSPILARQEFYRKTLERVLPRTRIIVLAPGETPNIDLHLLRSGLGGRDSGAGSPPSFDSGH